MAIDVIASGFSSTDFVLSEFHKNDINIRRIDERHVSVSFDEITTLYDLDILISIFKTLKSRRNTYKQSTDYSEYEKYKYVTLPDDIKRDQNWMTEPQFEMKYSETNMLRLTHRLADRDISLAHGMIPLGSCTMKLNPSISMLPVTWPGFSNIHPFAPRDQCLGYHQMIQEIEDNLIAITQYDDISM